MHCWMSKLISAWVNIYLLLVVTLYFSRGLPLPSNTTIARLSDGAGRSLVNEDATTDNGSGYDTHALNLNRSLLVNGSGTSKPDAYGFPVYNTPLADPTASTTTNAHYPGNATSNIVTSTVLTSVNPNNVTTDPNESDKGNPSLNLAIIPALAILVFLIVFCIRCCKWFRTYTRGGTEKGEEAGNHYASIVQEGDEDYGVIDILSDTTSTVYNDTVSSYCSFLRRSGNENTITSFRSLKTDIRQSTPKGEHARKVSVKNERKMYDHSGQTNRSPSSAASVDKVRTSRLLHSNSRDGRTVSASSEETEPLTGSGSDSSDAQHPGQQPRRSQRFKVSFVDSLDERSVVSTPRPSHRNIITSTSEFSPNLDERLSVHRSSLKLKRAQAAMSGQYRFPFANLRVSHSEKNTPVDEDIVFVGKKLRSSMASGTATAAVVKETVSVGVQTDKSFRYSLWKSKRRYFSDPGHDSSDDCAMDDLSTKCQQSAIVVTSDIHVRPFQNNTSKSNKTHHHSISSSVNGDASDGANTCPVSPSLGDTEQVMTPSVSPSDSSDDVFDMCDRPAVRYCKCSVPLCNNDQDTHSGDITKDDNSSQTNNKKHSEQDGQQHHQHQNENGHHHCDSTCQYNNRPLLLKTLHEDNEQNGGGKLPICSRCKSAVVILEGHQNHRHVFAQNNCDSLYFCDICFKNRSVSVQNGRMVKELDKENLLDGVRHNDRGDLIIDKDTTTSVGGNDLTSSMTSLESSGYAELSSESSN